MNWLASAVGRLPLPWIKAISRQRWRHPLAARALDIVSGLVRSGEGVLTSGPGQGLRFAAADTTAGMALGTFEPEVQAAFEAFVRPGMTVYDVGANVGFFSVIAAKLVGEQGSVMAFEPVEDNARRTTANAARNGFKHLVVHHAAVGDRDGRALFTFSDNRNWGTLAHLKAPPQASRSDEVAVLRLDTLRAGGGPAPDVIKLDAEGAEIEILEGARAVLREARPVLFIELHGTNARVSAVLEELDYQSWILNGPQGPVPDAPWDAKILSVPRERVRDLQPLVDRVLASPDGGNRRRRARWLALHARS